MILTALTLLTLAASQTKASDAASPGSATVIFQFENPQLQPAAYSIEISENGTGHYKSSPAAPAPVTDIANADTITPQAQDRPIRISEPLLSRIFAVARSKPVLSNGCEAPKTHVAFTGKKTLTYSGPDGHGSCTYNWSRDQQISQITDDLMAISYTLEEGARLAIEHEHSRLGLDAELEALQDAAKDRRALEIENISAQLESIANDDAVMNRARNRALALLNGSTAKQ
jgi:hypothetical protein